MSARTRSSHKPVEELRRSLLQAYQLATLPDVRAELAAALEELATNGGTPKLLEHAQRARDLQELHDRCRSAAARAVMLGGVARLPRPGRSGLGRRIRLP